MGKAVVRMETPQSGVAEVGTTLLKGADNDNWDYGGRPWLRPTRARRWWRALKWVVGISVLILGMPILVAGGLVLLLVAALAAVIFIPYIIVREFRSHQS